MGSNAKALVSGYKRINNRHIAQHGGKWEGITETEFTDDIAELTDAIVLTLTRQPAEAVAQPAV